MSMSDEKRQQMSDMMKARHAATKAAKMADSPDSSTQPPGHVEQSEMVTASPSPLTSPHTASSEANSPATAKVEVDPAILDDLIRQVNELKAQAHTRALERPQLSATGSLLGTYEKFSSLPSDYPDPTPRLSHEARLARFAFTENYELEFDVSRLAYETKDGRNVAEPRFTLRLIGIKFDDDGNKTNSRYIIRTLTFHEDPQAALEVARRNELSVDAFGGEQGFLDEMRYLRMRDWLLEAFYPPKRDQVRKNVHEEVLGGRVVQVFEASGVGEQKLEVK